MAKFFDQSGKQQKNSAKKDKVRKIQYHADERMVPRKIVRNKQDGREQEQQPFHRERGYVEIAAVLAVLAHKQLHVV